MMMVMMMIIMMMMMMMMTTLPADYPQDCLPQNCPLWKAILRYDDDGDDVNADADVPGGNCWQLRNNTGAAFAFRCQDNNE